MCMHEIQQGKETETLNVLVGAWLCCKSQFWHHHFYVSVSKCQWETELPTRQLLFSQMKMFMTLFVHALYVIELQKQAAPAYTWEIDVEDRKLQMYCEALKKSDDKLERRVFNDEYLCCWVIIRALLFIFLCDLMSIKACRLATWALIFITINN